MKKVILVLLLLPILLSGQKQVSDIKFDLPRDDHYRKGFIKIGQKEYFIEQGEVSTKISLINGNELNLLHELKFRPTDSYNNFNLTSYKNSNSGLIYDGSTLFELYRDYIYLIDIESGQQKEIIDLKPYQLSIQSDFEHGENFFYFRALGINGWSGNIRLDRTTGLIDTITTNGILADSILYMISSNNDKLLMHNLETNQKIEYPFQFSNIAFIKEHASDKNTRLIIKDSNGIYLLKNDEIITTLSCTIPDTCNFLYVSDNILAYETNNGSEIILTVKELQNCTIVNTTTFTPNFLQKSLSIFDDKQLFNEYFIFGFQNDWQGDGLFYLYDIENNSATNIDIPIDLPILSESVRYEDNLYFLTSNDLHYIGGRPELYKLNLKTKRTERISRQLIYKTWDIVIGEFDDNRQLNVYCRTEKTAYLDKIDDINEELLRIKEFDLNKNHGIYSSISEDLWVDNKYFFLTSNAIFVMVNDVTLKLTDIDLNFLGFSAFKKKGDYVYILTGIDNKYFALKININDLSYSKTLLSSVKIENSQRDVTENAIINYSDPISNNNSVGYYDLDSEEFVPLTILGLPKVEIRSVSGNNILCLEVSDNNKNWWIVNTKTREVTLTEVKQNTYPTPYPDNTGGFYMEGWIYDNSGDISFKYLNEKGKLSTIFENFNYNIFYGGYKFDGNVKSVAYDGLDSMIIISTKNGEVRKKTIPDNDLLYYQSYFWYESDNISFVDIRNGSNYDTYVFNFDTEPHRISQSSREERLFKVLEGIDYSILVYLKNQEYLTFEKYTYSTGTLEKIWTVNSRYASSILRNFIKIDHSKYLIDFNDQIFGSEPWIFDIDSGDATILKDIRLGFSSSNINDFTINIQNSDVYFSAIKTEGDRQLFKLEKELVSTKEVSNQRSDITLYPVPTNNYLILDNNFDNISITNVSGRLIYQIESYAKGDIIMVDNLPEGLYFLKVHIKNQPITTKRFVITRF
ncbi:MAG TPA: T9SS type A sorting domain-containing protein [Saprospiraceae bacterium]|nr:T9SS type A sorting domain-containing protein [Saprospiraceae bacterium]